MLNLLLPQQSRRYLVPLLIVSIIASLVMGWIISDYSAGVSPDSVIYLDTAKNILAGNGIVAMGEPMTHYPPGYPFLLALSGVIFQGDVSQGAFLLHSFLFGMNVFLVGLTILFFHNDKNPPIMIGLAILGFVFAIQNFQLHSMAWSDSPFITLVLLISIMLTAYVLRPNQYLLVGFSLLAGFAIVVRYIGITLLSPIVFVLFLLQDKSLRQRLKDILISITIAVTPLIVWFVRNIITSQTLANRESSFQFLGFHLDIFVLLSRFYDFVFPIMMPIWLKALQFVIAIGLLLFGAIVLRRGNYISRNLHSSKIVLPFTHAVFFVSYVSFMIFSQLFLEVRQDWDHRILFPPFLSLLFFAVALLWSLPEVIDGKYIRLGFVFVTLTSLGLNSLLTIPTARYIHKYGQGYNAEEWRRSEILSVFSSLHEDNKVYSNGPDVIWYWNKKTVDMLPGRLLSGTRQLNQEYEQELLSMCREIKQGSASLVYFMEVNRSYLPKPYEIERVCRAPLPVLYEVEDGIIYGR